MTLHAHLCQWLCSCCVCCLLWATCLTVGHTVEEWSRVEVCMHLLVEWLRKRQFYAARRHAGSLCTQKQPKSGYHDHAQTIDCSHANILLQSLSSHSGHYCCPKRLPLTFPSFDVARCSDMQVSNYMAAVLIEYHGGCVVFRQMRMMMQTLWQ